MRTGVLCGVDGELPPSLAPAEFPRIRVTPCGITSYELGFDVVRGAAGSGIHSRWGTRANSGTGSFPSSIAASPCNEVWAYEGTCGLGDFPTATVARWIGPRSRFVDAYGGSSWKAKRNCSTSWAREVLTNCHFPNRAAGSETRGGVAFMVDSHYSKGTFSYRIQYHL